MSEATPAADHESPAQSFGALLDRPSRVAGASALLATLVLILLAVAWGAGPGGFVHAAPPYTDRATAPSSLDVVPHSRGFDGQFYYRMVVSPFSTAKRVAGVAFDIPALRQQRIGYPALARLLTLGDRDAAPLALLVVNVAAMFALGWFGAALALDSGRAAAWGLLLCIYPGFVYSLGFDLAEIVVSALLVGTVLAVRRSRTAIAVGMAVLAVLTRETATLLPMGLAVSGAWPWWRRPDATERRTALVVGLVPLAVFAAWQAVLRSQWGSFPLSDSGDKNVRVPFEGLLDTLDRFLPPTNGAALFRDLSLAFLVLVIGLAGISFRRSSARRHEKIAFVLAVGMLPLLSEYIWVGATSFMRVATEAFVLALVVLLSARVAFGRLLVVATVATFGATVASELVKSP